MLFILLIVLVWPCLAAAAAAESALGRSEGTYSCGLADAVNALNTVAEAQFYARENTHPAASILSVLAENGGMGAPCNTISTPGQWWEYELCWGRWIRQYHVERPPNQPPTAPGAVSAEFLLGVTATATKSGDPLVASHTVQYTDGLHSLKRKLPPAPATLPFQFTCSAGLDHLTASRGGGRQMVVAHMTGGTMCDASKRARETRVVLACERRDVAVGWNISEHGNMPCHYTAFVFGRGVCALLDAAAARAINSPSSEGETPKTTGQVNPNLRSRGDVERLQRDLERRRGAAKDGNGRVVVPPEHATSSYADLPQAAPPVIQTPPPTAQQFRPQPHQQHPIQELHPSVPEEAPTTDPVPDEEWAETAERLERVMWFSLG
jgi:hypothetical protein